MTQEQISLLRSLPIEEVASRLGIEVIRHKALCPFHNDHHASLSFNLRKNTYRCFVCGAHGDTIDLARHLLYKDFREACQYLSNGTSVLGGFPAERTNSLGVSHSRLAPPASFDPSRYALFFQYPRLSPEARHFLFEVRRLDPASSAGAASPPGATAKASTGSKSPTSTPTAVSSASKTATSPQEQNHASASPPAPAAPSTTSPSSIASTRQSPSGSPKAPPTAGHSSPPATKPSPSPPQPS